MHGAAESGSRLYGAVSDFLVEAAVIFRKPAGAAHSAGCTRLKPPLKGSLPSQASGAGWGDSRERALGAGQNSQAELVSVSRVDVP